MKGNWWKTAGAGVAIVCMVMPLAAQGATKAELMQKSQQHRALTTGTVAPHVRTAANDQTVRKQKKALHAQKRALIKKRRTLAKQGNMDALNANSSQIDSIDTQLRHTKKGGVK